MRIFKLLMIALITGLCMSVAQGAPKIERVASPGINACQDHSVKEQNCNFVAMVDLDVISETEIRLNGPTVIMRRYPGANFIRYHTSEKNGNNVNICIDNRHIIRCRNTI